MFRLSNFLQSLKARVRAGHHDQSGAMVVLSLAAFLIIVMVGMVIFDVAEIGSEKSHLQTATDTAAFSQATVQARAMNQIAFANVGKRMTVGMVNTYINLNQFIHNLATIGTYLTVVCALAAAVFPALAGFCGQIAQAASGAHGLYSGESRIRGNLYSKSRPKCFQYVWRCGLSGCGWRCAMRYLDIHEWAAPISDNQFLTLFVTPIPCGKIPLSMKWGPLKCANGDIRNWSVGRLIPNYYGRDLLAMDNYQRYMASLAPYWAWTEGTMRGLTNAAPVTVSYPMPRFSDQQKNIAQIPVRRGTWRNTCDRGASQDRDINPLKSVLAFDITFKNLIGGLTGGGGGGGGAATVGRIAAMTWAFIGSMSMNNLTSKNNPLHQMLPRDWNFLCRDITYDLFRRASGGGGPFGGFGFGGGGQYVASFEEYGRPFLLHNYQNNRPQWLLDSSVLTIGFRPNADRFGKGAKSRLFVPGEYEREFPDVGGMWALSRSEMSYQGRGAPNAWSPGWTARMRPVALPGEWEAYEDLGLVDVMDELATTITHVTALAHGANSNSTRLIRHPHAPADLPAAMGAELLILRRSLQGLDDEDLMGVLR